MRWRISGRPWWKVLLACVLWLGSAAVISASAAPLRIGFSQVTTVEPWRILFNQELRSEASLHPEIELIIADANDNVNKQIADMEDFIRQKVNAILISPKEAVALTPVVEQAAAAGIPVFVLDRNVNTERYTQFIGGDNQAIGRAAGEYAIALLGGPGKARGRIYEIWGGMRTRPSQDRHDGFQEVIGKEPGLVIVGQPVDSDWKQHLAYEAMSRILEKETAPIDLVYAHNDPMAYGAYLAAKDEGRAKETFFLGIDGIPDEGVKWVHEGVLTATFLYKTPGDEGLRQVLKHLKGEVVPRAITLPTMVIDRARAGAILRQKKLIPE